VERILQIRRFTRIRLADLVRLRVSLSKVQPFLKTADHNPTSYLLDSDALRARFLPKPLQLELFPTDEVR
jgi:predicted DNA-binding helix-hairpin-helix protein